MPGAKKLIYNKKLQPAPDWEKFVSTPNKAEVLRFLVENGWEVRKQSFYNHCKEGKLRKNPSGLYSRHNVKKYASAWLTRIDAEATEGDGEVRLAAAKKQEEIRRLQITNARNEFKFEVDREKYIRRSDLDAELVARAIALNNGFVHLIQSLTPDMVALVKGD